MRTFLVAAVIAMAGSPALAQAALDGRATASGPVGDALREALASPGVGKEELRRIMAAAIGRQMPAEDKDLMGEFASGKAVDVAVEGLAVKVPALQGDVLAIAKLMATPPNLNTLWQTPGEPILQMIEMSRWTDSTRDRITGFMATKLYAAWTQSFPRNSYAPWVQEYAGVTNALMDISDPAVKTEMRLLLKSAVEQVFVKAKADGREPPPYFLYEIPLEPVGVPRPS